MCWTTNTAAGKSWGSEASSLVRAAIPPADAPMTTMLNRAFFIAMNADELR